MSHPDDIKKFDFGDSATYRIVVQGCLEESFSERLGGMRITTCGCGEQAPVTILEGRLIDQAELSGVLNSLYEMHLPILSVKVAGSLKKVAELGAKVVHGGEIGEAIAETMKTNGGFLALDDLVENQAEWWEPIEIDYRGHRVITASPPSTAFPSLVRLGMMSRFEPRDLGHNSAEYLHRFAEVTKHAFWTRLRYAGDPDVIPPPLDRLLSVDYWSEEVAKIDPDRAKPFEYPGKLAGTDSHTTAPAASLPVRSIR